LSFSFIFNVHKTSFSLATMYVSFSTTTTCAPNLGTNTVWPTLIRFGTKLPSGVIRPGPTANTLPISVFYLPMSGTTIFPYICSHSSFGRIITLSPKGEIGHSILNLIV